MMKSYYILGLVLIASCSAELYTTENDDLDIEGVVADTKTLKAFVDCFTYTGDCTELTANFRKDMNEAIEQACAKCTDAQKHIFRVFLDGLKEKLPAEFETYKKKYDPDNKYLVPLQAAVAKH